jgi:RNA polymerase sigma factor (sigma-70 family)
MNQKQRDLAANNLGLAYREANRWRRGARLDIGDLIGVGMLGLVQAALTFQPGRLGKSGKPVAFSTWATLCIRQAIHRAEMGERRHPATSLEDGEIDPPDLRDDADLADIREEVAALLDGLDERRRQVLLDRAAGLTLREIGERLGVSCERARQLEQSALRRVRK